MTWNKFLKLFLPAMLVLTPTAQAANTSIPTDQATLGLSTSGHNKQLIFNWGKGSINPSILMNASNGHMQFSNDGINFSDIATTASQLATQTANADTVMVTNTSYTVTKSSIAIMTLPATCTVGDKILINGNSTGNGWQVNSNSALAQSLVDDVVTRTSTLGTSIPLISSTSGYSQVSLVCGVTNTTWIIVSRNGSLTDVNYFGTGADSDVTYTTNTSLTVPNITGSFDGEAVVMNYGNLTINSSVTLTTSQPGRGLIIYVQGNLVVNGTITMNARGPNVNPSTPGAGSFLTVRRFKSGQTGTSIGTGLVAGMGAKAVISENNQPQSSGTTGSLVIQIPCVGGAGGASGAAGGAGSTVTNGTGGGGGGGPFNAAGGVGTAGTCFAGGSGGGGSSTTGTPGGAAVTFAGAGGGGQSGGTAGGNGAGNPCGSGGSGSCTNGNGGLLIIIVKGTITLGASSVISADGNSGANSSSGGGGGSGAGVVIILSKGTYTNNGTSNVHATGGAAGPGNGPGAGKGGDGTVIQSIID